MRCYAVGVADPEEHIRRWQRAGLLADAEAERLLAYESGRSERRAGAAEERPGVLEALLYLGFTVAGVGVFFFIAQQWDDLRSWARLMVVGVPALLALAAGGGMSLSSEPGVRRGGNVAWLLAVALGGGTLAVVFNEYGPGEGLGDEHWTLAVTGVVTLALALVLWALTPSHPQVVGVGGASFFFGMTMGAWPDEFSGQVAGLAAAATGVAILALVEAGLFRPRFSSRVAGSMLAGVGTFMAGREAALPWEFLAFAAGAALVALGVWRASFTYVTAGIIVLLLSLITFMFEHFEDRIGAPLALMLSGGLLVAAVLALVQYRQIHRRRQAPA
jgi:hypothetical protein